MGHFIDDGCTVFGKIKGREPLYSELRFAYRPMKLSESTEHSLAAMKVNNDKQAEKLQSNLVVKSLVSWNASKQPTAEEFDRLHHTLANKLYQVLTDTHSDSDPDIELSGSEFDPGN